MHCAWSMHRRLARKILTPYSVLDAARFLQNGVANFARDAERGPAIGGCAKKPYFTGVLARSIG